MTRLVDCVKACWEFHVRVFTWLLDEPARWVTTICLLCVGIWVVGALMAPSLYEQDCRRAGGHMERVVVGTDRDTGLTPRGGVTVNTEVTTALACINDNEIIFEVQP